MPFWCPGAPGCTQQSRCDLSPNSGLQQELYSSDTVPGLIRRSVWMAGYRFRVIKLILSLRAAKTNHISPWPLLGGESRAVLICQRQEGQASVWGCADQPWLTALPRLLQSTAWTPAGRRLTTRTTLKRQVKRDLRDTRQLCSLFSGELYCSRTTGITIHSTAGILAHIQSLPVSIWKQRGTLKTAKLVLQNLIWTVKHTCQGRRKGDYAS